MKLGEYIKQMVILYQNLIDFIENESESQYDNECIRIMDNMKTIFLQNGNNQEEEIKLFLHLILNIDDNHHRTVKFDEKIKQIIKNFNIKHIMSNSKIYKFFQKNKRILLYLIQNEILTIDNEIVHLIREDESYCNFFYPEIKAQLTEKEREIIEKEQNYNDFEIKRKIGENDSYICSLIRQDLIDEFIIYVNKQNLNLSSARIKSSIFETNSFLINKNPSLIEYAAFFGSIQIFQYLRFNNVSLESSLWLYSIHSKNPELIHLLEENHIEINDSLYEKCLIESIKCHHNDITDYFKDYLISNHKFSEKVTKSIIKNSNFKYFPKNFNKNRSFYYLCKYEYKTIVELYMNKVKDLIEPQIESDNITKLLRKAAQKDKTDIIYYILSKKNNIDTKCFEKCTKLTKVVIPPTITIIGSFSFNGCSSLSRVIIPNSVTRIESYAFCECEALNKISVPSSVAFIGSAAFHACSFREINIPPTVKAIIDWCFGNNKHLKKISIPPSVCYIGHQAFANCCSLEDVIIPSSVKLIVNNAFLGCSSFVNITIPPSVTEINESTFGRCTSLENINIPSSVKIIKSFAFHQCSSLKKIMIPSSVTHIENKAFFECPVLQQISIPSSLNIDNVELSNDVKIIRY